jgi:hypothetical protein
LLSGSTFTSLATRTPITAIAVAAATFTAFTFTTLLWCHFTIGSDVVHGVGWA